MTLLQRKPSYTSWLGAQTKKLRLKTTWGRGTVPGRGADPAGRRRPSAAPWASARAAQRLRGVLGSWATLAAARRARGARVRSEVSASAIALVRAARRRRRAAAAGRVAGRLPVDGVRVDARGRPRGGAGVHAPLGDGVGRRGDATTKGSARDAAFHVDRSLPLRSVGRFDIMELLHGDLRRLRRRQGARRSPRAPRPRSGGWPPRPIATASGPRSGFLRHARPSTVPTAAADRQTTAGSALDRR